MPIKGINMFPGINNTRSKRKILIILGFRNDFFPTCLQPIVNHKSQSTERQHGEEDFLGENKVLLSFKII